MARKVAGNPASDTTMPEASIEIKGVTYHLAFTYEALAVAQRELRRQGKSVNMLVAYDFMKVPDAEELPALLYAALLASNIKDFTLETAYSMVNLKNYGIIFAKLATAYRESMTKPDADQNPQEPAAK